jgi:hypothetical protein
MEKKVTIYCNEEIFETWCKTTLLFPQTLVEGSIFMLYIVLKQKINIDDFFKSELSPEQIEKLYTKMSVAHSARGGKINVERSRMNSLYRDFSVETLHLYFKLIKILIELSLYNSLIKKNYTDSLTKKVEYIIQNKEHNKILEQKIFALLNIYINRFKAKKIIDFARDRNSGMLPVPSFRGQFLDEIRHFVFSEAWLDFDEDLKKFFVNEDFYREFSQILFK